MIPPTLTEWLGSGAGWGSLAVGLFGGGVSGLLGVSSGGILVPGLALALSLDQHRAQGVSLAAQLLPTGLAGFVEYHRKGYGAPWRWILAASLGFLLGAYVGARLAGEIPERPLRWMFSGYLFLLATMMMRRRRSDGDVRSSVRPIRAWHLAVVGASGGLSSGLLGIGGGLAMTVVTVAAASGAGHQPRGDGHPDRASGHLGLCATRGGPPLADPGWRGRRPGDRDGPGRQGRDPSRRGTAPALVHRTRVGAECADGGQVPSLV